MLKKIEFIIEEKSTIKEFICNRISRNFYGYLKEHEVSYIVNGFYKKAHQEVFSGDQLVISYDEEKNQKGVYSDLPIDIVYEDEYFIVVDKEAHLQSIPSKNNPNDSVFNRLLYYFKDTNHTVHLINRLDKETKGLVFVAKSNFAAAIIKDIKKTYFAKTLKLLPENNGTINLPIARCKDGIKRCIDFETGKAAITEYKLIHDDSIYTYEVNLLTGRTHQIRLHFSYLNSPLINDSLYGGDAYGDQSLGLVCKMISFIHPLTKKKIILKSKYE